MNRLNYNISMCLGLCSITAGAVYQFGPGVGLMIGGSILIALTLIGLKVGS